ncbi:MAG TPA: phosphotransferase [Acidimicrobiales bacterium]|nr:phosphotransferase [Acidimicrobiales bacterium]
MSQPGRLIASGRDADIYDIGKGSVIRRTRTGRPLHHEAHVMGLAHAAGYPVPEVRGISDDGRDLTLERIDGPTLLDELASHPWRVHRSADLLAELLVDLHQISAMPDDTDDAGHPDSLRSASTGPGPSLIHLDLHPLNVLVSPTGPIVIDWANAGAGVAEVDVAVTWLVMAAAAVPGGAAMAVAGRVLRDRFVQRLLGSFDRAALRRHLPTAAAWKIADANLDADERARMQDLVDGETPSHSP